jgi:hypothetical protein
LAALNGHNPYEHAAGHGNQIRPYLPGGAAQKIGHEPMHCTEGPIAAVVQGVDAAFSLSSTKIFTSSI